MMADTDRTLTLNDESSFEEESFENVDRQIVNEDIEKYLINENNNDNGSSCSSAYSTPPSCEGENDTAFVQFKDSSGIGILTRAESLKNGEGNCDLCKMKNLQSPGDFYCRYCDKCFCQSCVSFHEELTPDHTVTNLLNPTTLSTKDVTPASTCDKHKLPITLYCDECHLCLCVACWEKHNTGDGQKKIATCPFPISLDLISTEKRTQGFAMLESLISFKEQAMKQSEFLDGIMSDLTEKSDRKCESLWNELEVLFTSLRHRLTQLISQIQAETYCQKSKLQRKSVSWKAYLRDVEGLQSKLDELLRSANDADLVSAFKDIKSKKESLDIDKFVPMMGVCPISVGVEYSKDYLNLHRNVPNFVLGKPRLTLGSTDGDNSSRKTLDQILTECRTDVGIQCDEKDFMPSNLLSNPFLFDDSCFSDLNMSGSNLNLDSKDCRSSVPKNISSTRNLHYLYNKDFFTLNDSGASGNNSFLGSSCTTSSDVSSLQSDFDISTNTNNVASPTINSGCDLLNERDNNFAVESSNTDFSPRQMPILKTSKQWSLILEKNTYVRGLTVTDDGHVFVCDRSSKKITQFDPNGKLMYRCDVSGIPWDVCAFSNSVLFVTLPQKSKILVLQRCTGKCLLAVGLAVSTGKKKYVSLTKVSCGMLACDNDANVNILDSNGDVLGSIISSIDQTGLDASHRICSGQLEGTFWTLNVTLKTISCHRIDGELLIYHRIAFKETTSDICSDCYNCIYGCDKTRIYCLTQEGGENILWTFKQELKNHPRMCVNSARNKLFVSYLSGNKNVLQIFNISPKFVLVSSINN